MDLLFDVEWAVSPEWSFSTGVISMADRGYKFTPGGSPDVVAYRVALTDSQGVPAGTTDVPVGHTAIIVNPDGDNPNERGMDLRSLPVFSGLDGTYDVEHREVDDAGQVSTPLLGQITVDFQPPLPSVNFEPWSV